MIVVIDNYDSFIYNVVQYFGEFHPDIKVFRNDALSADEVISLNPDAIVISPGPGRPENAGISMELIKKAHGDIPVFGVCLGHQAIGSVFGGMINYASKIYHGKTTVIEHTEDVLFDGLPERFSGARYHSLVVRDLPSTVDIIATSEGEVMAIRVGDTTYGVQFHPESVITENGKKIIENFVRKVVE